MSRFSFWRRRGLEAWVVGGNTFCCVILFLLWRDTYSKTRSYADGIVIAIFGILIILSSLSFASILWSILKGAWYADTNAMDKTEWVDIVLRKIRNLAIGIALVYYGALLLAKVCHTRFDLWGLGVLLAGLVLRLWACLYQPGGEDLETQGPYGYIRHPRYVGTAMIITGLVLIVKPLEYGIVGLVLLITINWITITKEELVLYRRFGERYAQYQRHVPAVFPRLLRISPRSVKNLVDTILNTPFHSVTSQKFRRLAFQTIGATSVALAVLRFSEAGHAGILFIVLGLVLLIVASKQHVALQK